VIGNAHLAMPAWHNSQRYLVEMAEIGGTMYDFE
jgi:hypothetical protein